MTNIAIPVSLVAIIMIGAVFAFMPVQEASTVHTTIQATSMSVQMDTFDATALAVVNGWEVEVITAGAEDFCLTSLYIEYVDLDAAQVLATTTVEIDGVLYSNNDGAATVLDFLTNPGGAVATSSIELFKDADINGIPLCSDGGSIDFILGQTGFIAGEMTIITATALVDGDVPIVVTIGAAD